MEKSRDDPRKPVLYADALVFMDHEPSGPRENCILQVLVLGTSGLRKGRVSRIHNT